MTATAIIFSGGKGDATTPVRDLNIGGLNSARRLTYALRGAGCARALIAADALRSMAPAAISRGANGLEVSIVPTAASVELPEHSACILVPADLLVDQRVFAAMLADFAPCVVATASKDPKSIIAKVPAEWLRRYAPLRLDHETFRQLVLVAREGAKMIDIQALDAYMPSQYRVVPMLWKSVTAHAEAKIAFDSILDAAQEGVQDWPTWFIHRPIERWITARLAFMAVTPNQITAVGAVAGLASAWLFAHGIFLPALVLALVVGIVDGIDGKLARVKLMTASLGEMKRVTAKIVEYLIYIGMARYFSQTGYGAAPYVMAGALILFQRADEVQLEFFRRMSGKFLCDFSSFDRRFRMVEGRCSTQLWTFLPFVLFDAWFAGFCMICAYGTLTFFIHQWRFVVAGRRMLEEAGPAFRDTFNRTSVPKSFSDVRENNPSWETRPDPESKPAE